MMKKWVVFGLLLFLLSSCVSKKKFDLEVDRRLSGEKRELALNQEIKGLNEQLNQRGREIAGLKEQIQGLEADLTEQENRNRNLQRDLNQLTNQALSQKQQLDAALQAKINELERKEKMIAELQAAIDQRDNALKGILAKIENALRRYSADELSVEMHDGRVYVALSDKMLFESGSAKVDKRGREALGLLAGVLDKHPDINIIVEGHTDNVPIRTEAFKDNWDLSVIRATSVVRILTKDFGISSRQVTAAGKGEFVPKASNETREGRTVNRRTEIIIEPSLKEIYKAIQNNTL